MANKVIVNFANRKAVKVNKWKVEIGQTVYHGRALLLYEEDENGKISKLKSKCVGTVVNLIAKEGEMLNPGDPVLEVEEGCSHPTVINDLCAECGADLQKEGVSESNATVPMVHHIPQLKVSQQEAQILGKADTERLLNDRKLVLLVDLDQTLIHTTHDNIPNNIKDVHHFQLGTSAWYHTRLRPNTSHFLKEMSQYFELHICTFGVRPYAHMVASILDRDKSLFSNRILSRDECFNFNSKVANLQALFPNGDELVCIIDDRKDVWNNSPNLIPVKPYTFFTNTGDINDPNLPPAVKHSDFFAKGVKIKKKENEDGGSKEGENDVLDVEDEDDYLLYLETILKKVHELFYNVHDKKIPGQSEVKWVLQQLKGSVLKGCEIVFSGLVPLHEGIENSEPYLVATDLGATIGKNVCETTTHIVAAKSGTAKLHASKKYENIQVVNPQWLTTCLYRWEQVDERLFPLISSKDDKKMKEIAPINLLLDDLMSMKQEVQAEFNSDSDDDSGANNQEEKISDSLAGENDQIKSVKALESTDKPSTSTGTVGNQIKFHDTNKIYSILKKRDESRTNSDETSVPNSKDHQKPESILTTNRKRSLLKPTILGFLDPNSKMIDSIKNFHIPKKVRIEETPQIRVIEDDTTSKGPILSPRKRKKKKQIAVGDPSTSGIQTSVDKTVGKDKQLFQKLQHLESSLLVMEQQYKSSSRFKQEEFRSKIGHSNDEHLALMKRINDETHTLIRNLTEKHNLSMQNIFEEHKLKMAHLQEGHLMSMKYTSDEHLLKMKLLNDEHQIKIKYLIGHHHCDESPCAYCNDENESKSEDSKMSDGDDVDDGDDAEADWSLLGQELEKELGD